MIVVKHTVNRTEQITLQEHSISNTQYLTL